ncbi:hypothetical protein [Kosakonia virus Kc318]|uniref:Uncharacterized protein n=1 Tax=Kosakonia virus Kc318 TaxID=2797327 RepID=A0AAE7TQ29_9CAUD|nr:hypothetical protein [Kosakonia virus Kc318]
MEKLHGVMATRGHCVGNGGLRGHSVGELFPCVIYQKGIPGAVTWWVRQPNGVDAGPHLTYEDAARSAESYNTGGGAPIVDVCIRKVQALRNLADETTGEMESFPFDEEVPFDYYGIYGVTPDGCLEHLKDYDHYKDARSMLPILQGRLANGPVDYYTLLDIVK